MSRMTQFAIFPKRYYLALLCALIALGQQIGHAQVPHFIPGDFHFRSRLTQEILDNLKDKKETIWSYQLPERFGSNREYFREYFGIAELEIIDIPENVVTGITNIYHEIRRDHPLQLEIIDENFRRFDGTPKKVEVNGPHVFVIPAKSTHRGWHLYYNEFFLKETDIHYRLIRESYKDAVSDLRYAHKYPPLPVVLPDDYILDKPSGKPSGRGRVAWKDVTLVILTHPDLISTIDKEEYRPFWMVSSEGAVIINYKDSGEEETVKFTLQELTKLPELRDRLP